MKIYRNLWAGNPTWFVETSHTRDRRNGFGFSLCKDGVYFQRQVSYFSSSIKEAPDRYPLVGEVTVEEMFDFVRSKCKEIDKDASQSAQAKDD